MTDTSTWYVTPNDLKPEFNIAADDNSKNRRLEEICEGVSRAIESDRGTRYWVPDDNEVWYFRGLARWNKIHIGAFVSVAEVATDAIGAGTYTVWDAADYYLSPANAVLQGLPYTEIERTPQTTKQFSPLPRGIRVTGKSGFSAEVPAVIEEAALLIALRAYERPRTPLGTSTRTSLGGKTVYHSLLADPDIRDLLDAVPGYRKFGAL